jgi:hypothetical protein
MGSRLASTDWLGHFDSIFLLGNTPEAYKGAFYTTFVRLYTPLTNPLKQILSG